MSAPCHVGSGDLRMYWQPHAWNIEKSGRCVFNVCVFIPSNPPIEVSADAAVGS